MINDENFEDTEDSEDNGDIRSFDEVFTEEDDDDDINFDDSLPGCNTLATFSFDTPDTNANNTGINAIAPTPQISNAKEIPDPTTLIKDNRTNPFPKGTTPPIDGEFLNVKRTYMLRASTVKKINALVACHPNISVYVSSIVDKAINHYYNHIVNEGGSHE